MVHTDGRISLGSVAMELDSLLFSEYREHALNTITKMLDPFSESDDHALSDIASMNILTFDLAYLSNILVFEADMPLDLVNQNSMQINFNLSCMTLCVLPTSLPSTSEAPNNILLLPRGTRFRLRLLPSTNIVV